ncbi:PTS sugar transporter subunit IIC [Carnobacterium divergens]|uniref:PTS sugar transporter subunit IIC n=1 Tax=Carnobacterium divergens TaxID=2748 RepID=UPI0010724AB9|nr:PTS transporter subunit EIIC [Carnobacterium divergens]TFI74743.1 PTS cellobiose transporter subunit IIC [Carnobacterium divergens]
MEKIMNFMTNSFAPKVNKVTKNVWVSAVQDSVMAILPFILVSSMITLISLVNEIAPILPDLSLISTFTFGLSGIFVAFLLPYFILEKKKIGDKKVLAGLTGIALYLLLIFPVIGNEGSSITFSLERFGAVGMFVSIVVGLFVGGMMTLFSKWSFFNKEETSLPDFIVVWFDSLIPIALIVTVGWFFYHILQIDVFDYIVLLFEPLQSLGQSFWGFVLMGFCLSFLYSFGISTWVLTPIFTPIALKGIADNAALVAKGSEAIYINTQETFYSGFCAFGGVGYTMILAILLLTAKSGRLKAIGRATFLPSLFNINEPLVYGAPIVFNPMLMIPFWLNGVVIPAITYLVLSMGWVMIPAKAFQLWYLPYPISTYLVNGDLKGILLFLFLAGISLCIWYPFFKVYDNTELKNEQLEN